MLIYKKAGQLKLLMDWWGRVGGRLNEQKGSGKIIITAYKRQYWRKIL